MRVPAQTYVGLLYGYLYTDGNLGRLRGAASTVFRRRLMRLTETGFGPALVRRAGAAADYFMPTRHVGAVVRDPE